MAGDSGRLPVWLQEGLATQFEVVRGGRWAGVGQAHDLRLPDWRAQPSPPPLRPLLLDRGFGRGYRGDVYAQSWALVNFLNAEIPGSLIALLDRAHTRTRSRFRRSGPLPAPRTAFCRACGSSPDAIEASWHARTYHLSTPLEAHELGRVP